MRHAEGRYEKHLPDEGSQTFEEIAKLVEKPVPVKKKRPATEGLVLVSPFDGIGGARRALEILGITPALVIAIEMDIGCVKVVKRAWLSARPSPKSRMLETWNCDSF